MLELEVYKKGDYVVREVGAHTCGLCSAIECRVHSVVQWNDALSSRAQLGTHSTSSQKEMSRYTIKTDAVTLCSSV